jgi:hypothetical protein
VEIAKGQKDTSIKAIRATMNTVRTFGEWLRNRGHLCYGLANMYVSSHSSSEPTFGFPTTRTVICLSRVNFRILLITSSNNGHRRFLEEPHQLHAARVRLFARIDLGNAVIDPFLVTGSTVGFHMSPDTMCFNSSLESFGSCRGGAHGTSPHPHWHRCPARNLTRSGPIRQ